MIKVLFVCLGNICRSPTAQGVFTNKVAKAGLAGQVSVDSAGTSGWHMGNCPDQRSAQVAGKRGYDLSSIRSRKVVEKDFVEQDLILAMDQQNLEALGQMCPLDYQYKLRLFLDFAEDIETREVPDPYYGGDEGFNRVVSLIEHGSQALLQHIRNHYIQ